MVIFTVFGEIYSIEYFCNTKVPGLGKIFVQPKTFGYTCSIIHELYTVTSTKLLVAVSVKEGV